MSKGQQNNKIISLLKRLDNLIEADEPLSEDQVIKYENSLLKIINSRLPKYLFHYSAVNDYSFDNFKSDRIYLNNPSNYNDPTDSMAYVNPDEVIQQVLGFGIIISEDDFSEDGMDDIDPDEELVERVQLANDAISTINYIRSRIKTVCFSEDIKSSLMWSHYAGFHTGYALRYKVDETSLEECLTCEERVCHRKPFPFYPVLYNNKRCDVSRYAIARALYNDMGLEIDERLVPIPLLPLIQKGKEWEYEKEWRILCCDRQRDYMVMKPDAIYLGSEIRKDNAVKFATIAHEKRIPIYLMDIDYFDSKFVLDYKDLTDYSNEEIAEMLPEPREWYGK